METNRTAASAGSGDTGPAPGGEQGERTTDGPPVGGAGGSAPTSGRTDTAPAPPEPVEGASGGGFFAWLRALGVPRRAGWLGGVCAGVGARLGIDPIIVRGIVVVLAVLGAPFVLVYAIAWLLLPDTDGEIHFERMLRGTIDPAVIGILILGLAGFLPLVQGGWLGWRWWPELPSVYLPGTGLDLMWPLRVLWVLAIVAAIVWFVVWLVRRAAADANRPDASGPAPAAGSTGPATAGAPVTAAAFAAGTVGATGAAGTGAAEASASPNAVGEPSEPVAPAAGAAPEDLAAWRAQHEAWRAQHAAWKAGQAEAARAARLQAAEENKAKSRELMAQADAARAARRLSRPRASAAFVFTALGLSLVGGAIAAITALGSAEMNGFAVPIALAVATLVLAAGMVVAALRRRRSGALAFFTMMTTLAMIVATTVAWVLPQGGRLVGPNAALSLSSSQNVLQPIGTAYLSLHTPLGPPEEPARVEFTQGIGDVWISINDNDRLRLDAREAGEVMVWTVSQDGSSTGEPQLGGEDRSYVLGGPTGIAEDDDALDAILVLRQGTGRVYVEIREDF